MFTINDYQYIYISYYIIIPELLPEYLPWNGFFQSSFFQEGCNRPRSIEFLKAGRDFQQHSIHTRSTARSFNTKRKSSQKKKQKKREAKASQKKVMLIFVAPIYLEHDASSEHPTNIQAVCEFV